MLEGISYVNLTFELWPSDCVSNKSVIQISNSRYSVENEMWKDGGEERKIGRQPKRRIQCW